MSKQRGARKRSNATLLAGPAAAAELGAEQPVRAALTELDEPDELAGSVAQPDGHAGHGAGRRDTE